MDTLLEGIDASVQPCTLAVVLPAVAVVIAAGRQALVAWMGFVIGCSVLLWARAADAWGLDRTGPLRWVVAALIAGAFWVLVRRSWRTVDMTFGAAVVIGALAGWLWRQCVGERLGDILNSAQNNSARTLALTPGYVTGVTLIALGIALVPVAVPRVAALVERPAWRRGPLVFAAAYAALVAVGRYDDLVAELLQRSTA